MTGRSLVLAIAGAALVAAAVALVVTLRGEYRARPTAPTGDARPAPVALAPADAPTPTPPPTPITIADATPPQAAPGDASADVDPRTEREALVAKVRDSGAGREAWDDQATGLFTAAAGETGAVVDSGCFIAGCEATLSFPSRAGYQHDIDSFVSSERYRGWTGGKVVTRAEVRTDGSVVVALVLYRPD
jgi:hypothetical protein